MDEFELSLGEVAERVGRSKPSVSNRLRLLELPEEVLWMVARGDLTEGTRAVLALPDHEARKRLAQRIARDGLSVAAAERIARDGGAARKHRAAAKVDPALAERARGAAERLTGLGTRQRGQARDPLRRGAPARGARRGARGPLAAGALPATIGVLRAISSAG